MMGYALIVCFALLAGIEALHLSSNQKIRFHEIPGLDSSIFWSTTGGSSDGQRISVIQGAREASGRRSFGYYISTFSQEGLLIQSCFVFLKEKHKLTNLIGSYEVSNEGSVHDNLVFITSSVDDDDSKKSIITIDAEDCQERENLWRHNLLIADKTSDRKNVFDIVIKQDGNTHKTCGNYGDCEIMSFDVDTNKVSELRPFVVNLTWPDLSFERLNDEVMLVYGINNDKFEWLLMDRSTGQSREMLSLLGFNGKETILHSGLTFCWINNQGVDTTVVCSRLDADDPLAAAKTVFFKKSVHLLFVYATTRNEILLVTGTLKEDLKWSYDATKIRRDRSYTKPMELPLPCVNLPSFSNAKYSADDNEVSFQYVCKQDDGFYHNEISIAMHDD